MHFAGEEPVEDMSDETLDSLYYYAILYISQSGRTRIEADRVEKGPACRIHRKHDEHRFLRVTVKPDKDSPPEVVNNSRLMQDRDMRTVSFPWLGRQWTLLHAKDQQQDKRHRRDPHASRSMRYFYYAEKGISAEDEWEKPSEMGAVFWNLASDSRNIMPWRVTTVCRYHIPGI